MKGEHVRDRSCAGGVFALASIVAHRSVSVSNGWLSLASMPSAKRSGVVIGEHRVLVVAGVWRIRSRGVREPVQAAYRRTGVAARERLSNDVVRAL